LLSTRQPYGVTLPKVPELASVERLIATKQPVVGAVVRAPRGGGEHLLPIRVPVIRDGHLKYALSAIVNVESLARLVPTNPDEWTRTIVDPDGTIAVRTRGSDTYVGSPVRDAFRALIRKAPETFSSETTREGEQVYAASSRSKYGWTAVVAVSRATADAPLNASITGVLAGGTVLMMCGLAAVLVISRRLSGDLAAATTAAEAVAAGGRVEQATAHVAETHRLQRALTTAATLLEKRALERDEQVRRADAARTEAEEANRTKDQFLAVLGHELRNPLAPALTALELMKARDANAFKRERQVLERQIAHMARLVNDLLDVSRLARGKIQLDRRRFELREAIDRAVDMARPLLDQQRHSLDVQVPATGLAIDADLDRIVQVLSNLLTNAAKYTPPGGRVALAASAAADRAVVTCEDNGPGVPPELVPKLFDTFAQGPRALDRREGGLGLGLALARTFTELHNGTIRVEALAGEKWSRFVVTLPLAPATVAPPPAVAPTRALEPSLPRRVLLVDDNADACEMLRTALGDAGHTLAIANNGDDALSVAGRFQPQVGVLDIGLPGMNGYELARRLRTFYPGIRLIALTGYGQTGDVEAALAAGFDAHCAKPVTTASLLELIAGPTLV
jgi:signal transduction histidine kinase